MIDIHDKRGISNPKLEHIFLGTVKKGKVSGYHCDKSFGDEYLYAEARLYPKSKRVITVNRQQRLFEAVVREKTTHTVKEDNKGKSSFFNKDWSRQEVVDCIDRLSSSGRVLKQYSGIKGINSKNVCYDYKTGIIVIDCKASTFPLLKY